MSRSNKDKKNHKGKDDYVKRDPVRKDRERGFRRHIKLEIKAGNYDLPDKPNSKRGKDEE